MNPTESAPISTPAAPTIFNSALGELQPATSSAVLSETKVVPRRSGYGMPCAKCKTYYAADLVTCPVCQSPDRIPPVPAFPGVVAPIADADEVLEDAGHNGDGTSLESAALEEERERFLREFKSQSFADTMQINATTSFRCSHEQAHQGEFEPAAVCQFCFDKLQGKADLAEAALLIDEKDATQIIYDAVWSDPSNPTKTYQNAAQALLGEMRRRAGISPVLGPTRMLTD